VKRPGETLECPYCAELHVVRENENGFSPGLDVRRFYVQCPALGGKINWAVVAD